jgi:outer membrane protein assembly factor BamB
MNTVNKTWRTRRVHVSFHLTMLALISAELACHLGHAGDWPQFRGPNRDGKAIEQGLLNKWPDGGPRLRWSVRGVGQGFTHVTVTGGVIYVTGLMGKEGFLSAYTPDGQLKWRADYGQEWSTSHPGARSIPTVHDGLVYVASGVGKVACFDAADGKQVWSVKLFEQYDAPQVQWGYAESLLVDGDKLLCTPCGKKATMVALRRKTGQPVWASPALGQGSSFCSPLLSHYSDLPRWIALCHKWLRQRSHRPADRREWQQR